MFGRHRHSGPTQQQLSLPGWFWLLVCIINLVLPFSVSGQSPPNCTGSLPMSNHIIPARAQTRPPPLVLTAMGSEGLCGSALFARGISPARTGQGQKLLHKQLETYQKNVVSFLRAAEQLWALIHCSVSSTLGLPGRRLPASSPLLLSGSLIKPDSAFFTPWASRGDLCEA